MLASVEYDTVRVEHKTLGLGTAVAKSKGSDRRLLVEFDSNRSEQKRVLLWPHVWATGQMELDRAYNSLPSEKKFLASFDPVGEPDPYLDHEWDAMTSEERGEIEDLADDGDPEAREMVFNHLQYGQNNIPAPTWMEDYDPSEAE
jgi:hypothetical protein